jgi:hypothetical protein
MWQLFPRGKPRRSGSNNPTLPVSPEDSYNLIILYDIFKKMEILQAAFFF